MQSCTSKSPVPWWPTPVTSRVNPPRRSTCVGSTYLRRVAGQGEFVLHSSGQTLRRRSLPCHHQPQAPLLTSWSRNWWYAGMRGAAARCTEAGGLARYRRGPAEGPANVASNSYQPVRRDRQCCKATPWQRFGPQADEQPSCPPFGRRASATGAADARFPRKQTATVVTSSILGLPPIIHWRALSPVLSDGGPTEWRRWWTGPCCR